MALCVALVAELVALGAVIAWKPPSAVETMSGVFRVPVPLPRARPGTPIRVWELDADGVAGAVYGVMYHSQSLAGTDIAVTGYVAVPDGAPPKGGWPVVALGHGTVGMADTCSPSRDPGRDVATINPFLKRGWVVAATDFEGIGGSGRHPYLVGESEARSLVDGVRATRALLGSATSSTYVAWGLSQGGHAALFARVYGATWAPELKLAGAVALAPVSDVGTFVSEPTIAPDGITLLAVAGLTAAYPKLRPQQVLAAPGLARLGLVDRLCLAALDEGAAIPYTDLRRADPLDVPAWRAVLTANTPGSQPSTVPVLVVQGTKDPIVPLASTEALFDRLCASTTQARLDVVAGGSHGDIVRRNRSAYLDWMQDRLDGVPATSNCSPTT